MLSKKSIDQNCISFVVFFLSAVHCGLESGQVKLFLAFQSLRSKRKDMWNWNQDSVRG
jgi:hypothetical protein